MDIQILIGLILTVVPFIELRGGLPVVIEYAVRNGLSVWPYFLMVLILNILLIFFIFAFFDLLHESFMRLKWYRSLIGRVLKRVQKKAHKIERRMDRWGYLGLMLFVAVPLPLTGAWTGTIAAWVMGLDRLKSFVAIAAGVTIAGLLILLISLGLLSLY